MGRVLAISSQVARGTIGLSAALPALQTLGHDVVALPTILLSNHPGHPRFAGERIAASLLHRMLDALDANGWLTGIDAILTGYLPSAEHVAFAEAAVTRVKARSPEALYLCDPVLGDDPKGVYIAEDAAAALRTNLVPIADALKMNRFEAAWLSGAAVATVSDVTAAASNAGWKMAAVTSLPTSAGNTLANVLVAAGAAPVSFEVARCNPVPNGTGDLLAALWLGHLLHGTDAAPALHRAVNGVATVIAASRDTDELQLVRSLPALV